MLGDVLPLKTGDNGVHSAMTQAHTRTGRLNPGQRAGSLIPNLSTAAHGEIVILTTGYSIDA